jgi:hypothetical protein
MTSGGTVSEPIHIPEVEDVLDWSVSTESGPRPLRHLTADDLLYVAAEAASTGAADLADAFATVAENLPDGETVADLTPARFHELFWGTTADAIPESE